MAGSWLPLLVARGQNPPLEIPGYNRCILKVHIAFDWLIINRNNKKKINQRAIGKRHVPRSKDDPGSRIYKIPDPGSWADPLFRDPGFWILQILDPGIPEFGSCRAWIPGSRVFYPGNHGSRDPGDPGSRVLDPGAPGSRVLVAEHPGSRFLDPADPGSRILDALDPGSWNLDPTDPGSRILDAADPGSQILPLVTLVSSAHPQKSEV